MKMNLYSALFSCAACLGILAPVSAASAPLYDVKTAECLQQGFREIPDSIQTAVYWYWISDNISKDGVIGTGYRTIFPKTGS